MKPRLVSQIVAVVLLTVFAGCGSEPAAEPAAEPTVAPPRNELPGAPVLAAEELAVDHPCGHGFAKGSPDQTLALIVFFAGEWMEEGPALDEPIELGPGSDWSARITVGEDLFANWCDDVMEEGEPTPRIDREYLVTQGTLVGEVDARLATAVLTDVVAVWAGDDGDVVEWAQIELRNEAWGFFAG